MYQNLLVWKKSVRFVSRIYLLTRGFPKSEMFGIIDQSRRASVSIPTNIAEGFGRNSRKEFLRFLRYAMGSLFEIQTHLRISLELNYISQHQYNCFYNDSREIERMLSALINKLVYLETHNMKKPG